MLGIKKELRDIYMFVFDFGGGRAVVVKCVNGDMGVMVSFLLNLGEFDIWDFI